MISINIIRRGSVLVAGLSATALLAACSSGSPGGGPAATHLSPRHALLAAATQARKLNSATERLTTRISGSQSVTVTGNIRVQLKPTTQLGANLKLIAAGKSAQIKEILTGEALYLNIAALTRQVGKPWVKIDLSALKAAGASFAQLYNSLQNSNVSEQAQLFTSCKNARGVGTATVDGVPTTEYACSISAAKALKSLRAGIGKFLGPELRAMGNSVIRFRVWIDHQNQIRKEAEVVTVSGQTIRTTVTITAINQPVHITPPPASQTATLPGL